MERIGCGISGTSGTNRGAGYGCIGGGGVGVDVGGVTESEVG